MAVAVIVQQLQLAGPRLIETSRCLACLRPSHKGAFAIVGVHITGNGTQASHHQRTVTDNNSVLNLSMYDEQRHDLHRLTLSSSDACLGRVRVQPANDE